MIKKPFFFFVIFCLFFCGISECLFSAAKYGKPRLFIKFQGNINFLDGGLFQDMIDEDSALFEERINAGQGFVISTDVDSFFSGYGAEIGIVAGKYAVGVNIGFLSKKYQIDQLYNNQSTGYEWHYASDQNFSAMTIFIFNHFQIINGSFIRSYFSIGGGMYLAELTYQREDTFVNGALTFQNTLLEAKRNFLGLHLGATLELNITKNAAIFVEALYRYVSFKNFTGTLLYEDDNGSSEVEGDLIYIIWKDSGKGNFWIGDYNENYYDERPVSLNMNGFSIRAGIKITFGSRDK